MALILNLSLRSNGKNQFQAIQSDIIRLLSELADHSDLEVKSYARITLYSLLNRDSFKKEATRQGLKHKLQKLQEEGPPHEAQR